MRNSPLRDENEAADFLRRSPRTLQHWRRVGGGPIYAKVGKRVVYREQDLNDFIARSLRTSTREHLN